MNIRPLSPPGSQVVFFLWVENTIDEIYTVNQKGNRNPVPWDDKPYSPCDEHERKNYQYGGYQAFDLILHLILLSSIPLSVRLRNQPHIER